MMGNSLANKFRHDITLTLRGVEVLVEFNADSPEPDVGVFSYQLADYRILDDDGKALDLELTEEELQHLITKVQEQLRDSEYEDYEDWSAGE